MSKVFQKNEVKTENIVIRVTGKQKMAIVERARDVGISVSEYILGVCGQDLDHQAWLVRNDVQKSISDLHRLVESAGFSWSVTELCRQVFITGLFVLSETYKSTPDD